MMNNSFDPEKTAKEILESDRIFDKEQERDLTFYESEIEHTKKWFGIRLKKIEEKYRAEVSPTKIKHDIIMESIELIVTTARYSGNEEEFIAAMRYYSLCKEVFSKDFGRHIEGYMQAQKLASFLLCLEAFGGEHNAMMRLISRWTGEKEPTLKKYYREKENKDIWLQNIKSNNGSPEFVAYNHLEDLIDVFLDHEDKAIRSGSNSRDQITYSAFEKLKIYIIEKMRENKATKLKVSPFSIAPNFQESEAREKQIEAFLKKLP